MIQMDEDANPSQALAHGISDSQIVLVEDKKEIV